MNLIERLFESVGLLPQQRKNYAYRDPRWATASSGFSRSTDLQKPMAQHPWIYACVKAISQRIAGTPYRLYEGLTDAPRQIESGPLYDVFYRPNNYWSHYHLWQATCDWLLLDGNALWVLDMRDRPTDEPQRIWVYDRKRFEPNMQGRDLIDWTFTTESGTKITLPTFNVIWFTLPNPYSEYWGLPPYAAAAQSTEQDWLASQWNREYFENSADPGGVLEVEKDTRLTDIERERALAKFENRHGGPGNNHRVELLEQGMTYKPTSPTHKDMGWGDLKSLAAKEICAVYHVPPSIVENFDDVQKHVQEGVLKQFWEGTIVPLMRLVEETLRAQLWTPYNNEATWGAFDLTEVEPLKEGMDAKIQRAKSYFAMGVPFNQLNESLDLGLEDIEGGDIGYLPIGLTPIDMVGQFGTMPTDDDDEPTPGPDAPEPKNEPPDDAPEEGEEDIEREDEKATAPAFIRNHTKAIRPGSDEHVIAATTWLKALGGHERGYKSALRVYHNKVLRWFDHALLNGKSRYGDPAALPADMIQLPGSFDTDLSVISRRHYEAVAESVGPQIERNLRDAGYPFRFDPKHPQMAELLKRKTVKVVSHINQERLREGVRDVLVRGTGEGWGWDELRDKIYSKVGDSRTRAHVIARTETSQAANAIHNQAEIAVGVRLHQWVASLDERTRETHLQCMALGAWPVKAVFPPTQCRYAADPAGPAEEVIQCRCRMMAVE